MGHKRWILAAAVSISLASWTGTAAGQGSTSAVQYFSASQLDKGFARSATLLGGENQPYSIITVSRKDAGQVEVHATQTDLLYVVEGSALFVTGGRPLELKNTTPGESRGRAIEGGEEHRLSKGDLIVVPAGVPHWFKQVDAPLVKYLAIKVRKAQP